jgi:AmmeMemoRadiSam system protein B
MTRSTSTRDAAVAGSWYPASAGALAREVDTYVDAAAAAPEGDIHAIIAPHAGILFSGPVSACAYKAVSGRPYDVAVLVGPSHFVAFDGVALYPRGAFATPLGAAAIDEGAAAAIVEADRAGVVAVLPSAHAREHSLEMQLPFLRRLLPDVPIVPMLMGHQDSDTIRHLADALAGGLQSRRALIVASTDLSHYFDARRAATLDGQVRACVEDFDEGRLLGIFESYPYEDRGRHVGCGIGPALSVMMAARALGARQGRVLKYAHSGEVSGDYDGVVGYLAAALGNFSAH